jgi:hypothetical protein
MEEPNVLQLEGPIKACSLANLPTDKKKMIELLMFVLDTYRVETSKLTGPLDASAHPELVAKVIADVGFRTARPRSDYNGFFGEVTRELERLWKSDNGFFFDPPSSLVEVGTWDICHRQSSHIQQLSARQLACRTDFYKTFLNKLRDFRGTKAVGLLVWDFELRFSSIIFEKTSAFQVSERFVMLNDNEKHLMGFVIFTQWMAGRMATKGHRIMYAEDLTDENKRDEILTIYNNFFRALSQIKNENPCEWDNSEAIRMIMNLPLFQGLDLIRNKETYCRDGFSVKPDFLAMTDTSFIIAILITRLGDNRTTVSVLLAQSRLIKYVMGIDQVFLAKVDKSRTWKHKNGLESGEFSLRTSKKMVWIRLLGKAHLTAIFTKDGIFCQPSAYVFGLEFAKLFEHGDIKTEVTIEALSESPLNHVDYKEIEACRIHSINHRIIAQTIGVLGWETFQTTVGAFLERRIDGRSPWNKKIIIASDNYFNVKDMNTRTIVFTNVQEENLFLSLFERLRSSQSFIDKKVGQDDHCKQEAVESAICELKLVWCHWTSGKTLTDVQTSLICNSALWASIPRWVSESNLIPNPMHEELSQEDNNSGFDISANVEEQDQQSGTSRHSSNLPAAQNFGVDDIAVSFDSTDTKQSRKDNQTLHRRLQEISSPKTAQRPSSNLPSVRASKNNSVQGSGSVQTRVRQNVKTNIRQSTLPFLRLPVTDLALPQDAESMRRYSNWSLIKENTNKTKFKPNLSYVQWLGRESATDNLNSIYPIKLTTDTIRNVIYVYLRKAFLLAKR